MTRAYDTYTSGTISLSGVQYRYINAMPFICGDYYSNGKKLNPFVGLAWARSIPAEYRYEPLHPGK